MTGWLVPTRVAVAAQQLCEKALDSIIVSLLFFLCHTETPLLPANLDFQTL